MISIIAAAAKNGVIGLNGSIPWNIPEDLAYFKKLTMGKTVIMGRKTYESIGHPLPGRFNIIISSINNYFADNCITVPTLEAALANTKSQEVFICGGCSVYKEALPVADRIYLTEIDAEFFGDVFFPEFDKDKYIKTISAEHKGKHNYTFAVYERIKHTADE